MSRPLFVLVGLGNPGPKYAQTRHNAGFLFVEDLVQKCQGAFSSIKFQSLYCRVVFEGHDVVCLLPQTFMNRSGSPVREALQFFKCPVENLIVVSDDLDQQPGTVRCRKGGGHGGQNGIRDILANTPSDNFHRIKFGIGKPEHKTQTADWVLSPFPSSEWEVLRTTTFSTARERLLQIMKQQ
jgi:peptidyl-tRNA hydrolase, PTH1 family